MMLKITGIVVCEILVYTLLKQYRPEYAVLSEAVCGVILLFAVSDELEKVLDLFGDLFLETGAAREYLSVLVKALGTALAVQFTADLSRDAGNSAAAVKIEFAGKVIVMASAIPLVEGVVGLIAGFAEKL
ncbi:MAG: stage III sporulation protein AD [Clostridia bacterium]|nr:stage III sporulation protein AD [Clostridia bacterium]